MSKLTIERELKKLGKEYDAFYNSYIAKVKAVKAGYKNLYHKCVNCGKRTQLGKLIMVVEQYSKQYEDYSYDTDTRYLICPHCSVMNRFYDKNEQAFVDERTAYLKVIYWLPSSTYFFNKKQNIYDEEIYLELLHSINVK